MTTKDIVLLLAGVAVGHLLATYLRKNRENAQETKVSETTSETNTPIVDQEKIDKCNQEVKDIMMRSKFGKGANLDEIRKQKFDACMSRNA